MSNEELRMLNHQGGTDCKEPLRDHLTQQPHSVRKQSLSHFPEMILLAYKPGASFGPSAFLRDRFSVSIIQYPGKMPSIIPQWSQPGNLKSLRQCFGHESRCRGSFIPAQLWKESIPKTFNTKSSMGFLPVCHHLNMFICTFATILIQLSFCLSSPLYM